MEIRNQVRDYLERTDTPPMRLAIAAGKAPATLNRWLGDESKGVLLETANAFARAMEEHPNGVRRFKKRQ